MFSIAFLFLFISLSAFKIPSDKLVISIIIKSIIVIILLVIILALNYNSVKQIYNSLKKTKKL